MRKLLIATAAVALLAATPTFADDQVNAAAGVGSFNTGSQAAVGVQATAFSSNVSQDVTALGASTSVSQVNVDGDDDQYNGAYFVGAANTASVAAVGIQGNLLVGKATQSVGAFGAQTSVGQVNKDSDDDQKNNAMFVGTLNTGDVAAAGTQVNVLTGKASQDVNASGAGTFIAQKNAANYGEDDQTNNVSFAGTLNTGAVAASGTQINGAVFRATQSVSAIGAGVSVDQINANTDGSQRNVASGILSVNVGPTAAAGTQLNLGVAKASQSIGSVGSSANISQANRYND